MSMEDVGAHCYTLARHPRNQAIVDIRNKTTNELKLIKIRHRLTNFYAMSLIDPKTFDVWAETQVKSAGTRLKPITLQGYTDAVLLKDTSIFGLEWTFEWENQKYKWIRESPIRPSLECRAVAGGLASNKCVARYVPRGVKNEYFGLITVLNDNLVQVEDKRAMDLLLITSLMTILDKTNDTCWKKEKSSGTLFLEPNEIPSIHHPGFYDGAKNRYDDLGGAESDNDDSGNSSNNDDDKLYDQPVDTDRQKPLPSTEQQQQQQQILTTSSSSTKSKTTTTTKNINNEAYLPEIQQFTDNGDGGACVSQLQQSNKSPHAHDLLSHQRQQLEYLGHMMSEMKHPVNATVTLPHSFVQRTTIDTITSWTDDSIGSGRRSLQTSWHQNNHRDINISHANSSNNYVSHFRYNNVKEIKNQQAALQPTSSSSRQNSKHHHRTRSHRQSSPIDSRHWIPFARQRQQPPPPAQSTRNTVNLHYSIPSLPQQYDLQ